MKKLTKAKTAELKRRHKEHNDRMRGVYTLTFEEFVDYVYGKNRTHKKFEEYRPQYKHRTNKDVPSVDHAKGSTDRKESPKYTGDYVQGIATMHKSNAVPVTSKEHAVDLAKMRRN